MSNCFIEVHVMKNTLYTPLTLFYCLNIEREHFSTGFVDLRYFLFVLKTLRQLIMLLLQMMKVDDLTLRPLIPPIKRSSPPRRLRNVGLEEKKGRIVEELIGSKGNWAQKKKTATQVYS